MRRYGFKDSNPENKINRTRRETFIKAVYIFAGGESEAAFGDCVILNHVDPWPFTWINTCLALY